MKKAKKSPRTKFKNPRRRGNEQFLSLQERTGEVTKEQPIFFSLSSSQIKKKLS
jgi:hypothetical protein